MPILIRNAAAILVLASLCACGSGQSGSAPAKSAAHVAKKAAVSPADTLSRDMVAAVTSVKLGSSPLPLQVKFELGERPEVAQPLEVNLAIVPTAPNFDRIYGKIEGEEGLDVVGSAELGAVQKPAEGVPIRQTFKVLPKQDGIYTLTATISGVDSAGQVSTQAYSIPIIAGRGFPDLPSKPAGPAAPAAKTAASQAPTPATR